MLEDAGGDRIRDAATKDLVSSREVVDGYNTMRQTLVASARALLPFIELVGQDTQDTQDTQDAVPGPGGPGCPGGLGKEAQP